MSKQIKMWVVRDPFGQKLTQVFRDSPKITTRFGDKMWDSASLEFLVLKSTLGLKPGECVPAILTVQRKRKPNARN